MNIKVNIGDGGSNYIADRIAVFAALLPPLPLLPLSGTAGYGLIEGPQD